MATERPVLVASTAPAASVRSSPDGPLARGEGRRREAEADGRGGGGSGRTVVAEASATALVNVYNIEKDGWEPFLEPWGVRVRRIAG